MPSLDLFNLSGKRALITGSSRSNGFALARGLAGAGGLDRPVFAAQIFGRVDNERAHGKCPEVGMKQKDCRAGKVLQGCLLRHRP